MVKYSVSALSACIRGGIAISIVLGVIASVLYALAYLAGDSMPVPYVMVLGLYFGCGIAGGFFVFVFLPFTDSIIGSVLVGWGCAFLAYVATALLLQEPLYLGQIAGLAAAVGGPGGLLGRLLIRPESERLPPKD